jgi:hypothetical protein
MFSTIVIVIVVLYVCGYSGMIINDLFFKKDPVEFMPKPKDVEIDISDEAGQFKPITVGKEEPKAQPVNTNASEVQSSEESTNKEFLATNYAAKKSDDVANGDSERKDEKTDKGKAEDKEAKLPTAASTQTSEPQSDSKPTDDIEPRPTDAETKKRIQELIKIRRQEKLAEEMSEMGMDSERTKDDPPSEPGVRIIGSQNSVSLKEPTDEGPKAIQATDPPSQGATKGESKPAVSVKASKSGQQTNTAKVSKSPKPPKPPKQPEHHNDAYFDMLKVQVDDSKQHTKLQGAQTAEQVSKEAKQASLDEAMMITKKINERWELKENNRVPDESESKAIEESARLRREAPPQFNI